MYRRPYLHYFMTLYRYRIDNEILSTKMALSMLLIHQKLLTPRHSNTDFHKQLILAPKFKVIYVTITSVHQIRELSVQ